MIETEINTINSWQLLFALNIFPLRQTAVRCYNGSTWLFLLIPEEDYKPFDEFMASIEDKVPVWADSLQGVFMFHDRKQWSDVIWEVNELSDIDFLIKGMSIDSRQDYIYLK